MRDKDQLFQKNREKLSDDWQETLAEAKRQYQQYVEVSELYKLPKVQEVKVTYYQAPSLKHPLTTNTVSNQE